MSLQYLGSWSCFEMLLSVPENELNCEEWLLFQQSLKASHVTLTEFGHKNLQCLVDATKEGGVWKKPIIVKILAEQKVEPEEVAELIEKEGASFLELRIKHLMKTNSIAQAMVLSKLCTEATETSNTESFRQSYISCLCTMLPNEEAIKEISKVDCREVLNIICNLETEGHDNTAFILCTTYLTQQLQTESTDCSWELTLFWSKLQRRIEPSLDSFLERCRQFGVIAKTLQHLFFLIRVVHAEAEEEGLPISILLCVRALQIKSDENDMKASVCKTIACLLPHDLEVRRACQLTEFLLDPNEDAYNILEALYLQPDQKFDEENTIVPNSLRCELLLALKAHWPFDPEFWDWKTLNRHCLKLLGKEASESEDHETANDEMGINDGTIPEPSLSDIDKVKEQHLSEQESLSNDWQEHILKKQVGIKKPVGSSERYQRWLQYKFHCLICNRDVIEARILHHAKMHLSEGVYTCPVCVKKFKKKEVFVPHVMDHVKMPSRHRPRNKTIKKERMPRSRKEKVELISYTSPDENSRISVRSIDPSQYVTFRQLEEYNLQDRDLYPCPGTGCSRIFKQFKYLSVHLKAEHQNNDENAKHYLDIKNKREKCGFCRRHFITDFHLRDHEQMHVGPQPFMCVSIDCFAKFSSVNELVSHKQTHIELQYKCELKDCNIVFSDLGQLFHHEAQHFRDASSACNFPGCKKFYYSKIEFQNHFATHDLADYKPVSDATNQVHALVTAQSENSPCAFHLPSKAESVHSFDMHESEVLSLESSISQIVPEIKIEPGLDANVDGESSQNTLLGNSVPLLDNHITSALDQNHVAHPQIGRGGKRTVLNIRANNKFFVSSRLKEQFNIFSVTFDGKKFTCGFEGCGVTRKNTRGMHTHLQNEHAAHFKTKKRVGVNARNLLQLFSGKPRGRRPKKLGMRQDHLDKKDAFKRRLVCNTNVRRKRVLKGEMCRTTAQQMAIAALPRVLSIEDAMLDLLLGLKHLSLQNTNSQNHSPTSLQKPVSFQAFQSACSISPDLTVNSTVFECNSSEQVTFTKQCIDQLAAKPFYCELQGCKYAFVTKDALLVHYVKKHNYSKESVLQFNMFKDKFAPFQCHICERAFTRRTHLRIHYRKKHQLNKVKFPQRLLSTRNRKENKALQTPIETIFNRSPNSCSTSTFRSSAVDDMDDDDDDDLFVQHMKREICRFKKGESFSETENDSLSEDTDDHLYDKPPKFLLQDRHREDLKLKEGRGSKRTTKGDLCYMLNKYHKPYHCIHKGCNSSFTNQQGLIRHYRIVHQYNKEQLCLEKDKEKSKSNYVKYKKIFVCKYKGCGRCFQGSKSLARHCSDIHNLYNGGDRGFLPITESARFSCNQPKCLARFYTFDKLKHHQMEVHSTDIMRNKDIEIRCELNGCDRLFTHHSTYSQHVYFSHRECYDDIFGRTEDLEDIEDSALEGETFGPEEKGDFAIEKHRFHNRRKIKKVNREFGKKSEKNEKAAPKFRTREEAVNMCLEEIKHTQFPCMVHGCLSVVKLESSIVRHYKRSHFFSTAFIEERYEKLVLCVKYGMRDKGESHLEVHAKQYYMNRGSKRTECLLESGRKPPPNDFHYRDKENENCSRNAVGKDMSFNTDPFLCKGNLKYNRSSNAAFEGCVKEPSYCKSELGHPGGSEKENKSCFSSFKSPFKRKHESDDWERRIAHTEDSKRTVHTAKDNCQKQSMAKTFDLKSFKPMGFESSFLKFIQEREHKDEYFEEQTEWEPEKYCAPSFFHKMNDSQTNFLHENIQEVSRLQSGSESLLRGQVRAYRPLTSPTDAPTVLSLQNLRSILDKALTDCGDLALKQLHYLRPVVVLERSTFSTPLVHLFPAKKTDGLCVGSS
ncbi:zinc finger protein Rlf isoform X2 [Ambystoma mexicanum]|uniref:zinc finger protein Rlf isoform X2 n=1 Tax=Ambystoma mexicanum TaxID=8296 RepID=UPI0037E9AF21